MDNKLPKKDKDFLDKLFNVEKEIYSVYCDMAVLEHENKLVSDDFNLDKDKLKDLLKIEEGIKNIADLSNNNFLILIAYLQEMISITNEKDKKIIFIRAKELLFSSKIYKDNISNLIIKCCESDVSRTTAYYLEKYIYSNNKIGLDYIQEKYNLIFSHRELEKEYINNDFKINNELYLTTDLMEQYLKVDDHVLDKKESMILEQIELSTRIIKEIPEYAFKVISSTELSYFIVLKCNLKAWLIMLSDELFNQLSDIVNNSNLKDEKNMFIKEIFTEVSEDRKRMTKVSFIRYKN